MTCLLSVVFGHGWRQLVVAAAWLLLAHSCRSPSDFISVYFLLLFVEKFKLTGNRCFTSILPPKKRRHFGGM